MSREAICIAADPFRYAPPNNQKCRRSPDSSLGGCTHPRTPGTAHIDLGAHTLRDLIHYPLSHRRDSTFAEPRVLWCTGRSLSQIHSTTQTRFHLCRAARSLVHRPQSLPIDNESRRLRWNLPNKSVTHSKQRLTVITRSSRRPRQPRSRPSRAISARR